MRCTNCSKELNVYDQIFKKCPNCNETFKEPIIHKGVGDKLFCGLGIFDNKDITHTTPEWVDVNCKKCLRMRYKTK